MEKYSWQKTKWADIKNFFIILLQSKEDCDKINTYRTRNALAKQLSNNIDNLNGGMKLWQRKLY